jgi:hypothetical protein
MEDMERGFEEGKRKQEEELRRKAAFAWLKARFREENAKRLERRVIYEKAMALRKLEERTRAVEESLNQRRLEIAERAHVSAEMSLNKQRLIEEITATIRTGRGTVRY